MSIWPLIYFRIYLFQRKFFYCLFRNFFRGGGEYCGVSFYRPLPLILAKTCNPVDEDQGQRRTLLLLLWFQANCPVAMFGWFLLYELVQNLVKRPVLSIKQGFIEGQYTAFQYVNLVDLGTFLDPRFIKMQLCDPIPAISPPHHYSDRIVASLNPFNNLTVSSGT